MKIAVVLFNLGGPDGPDAVEPFLRNLFSDPAIIKLPGIFRRFVAWLIARRRAPVAREIYQHLGGGSPLLPNTIRQAEALEAALGADYRCFIAMRYWNPRAAETFRAVVLWKPDRVVLLPLYPQFSSTTTGSSLKEWDGLARGAGLEPITSRVCCWPDEAGLIDAVIERIRQAVPAVSPHRWRILFSAHGLPKQVVSAGDPYQWQVERTVVAVVERLGRPELDHAVCYQSRVGPLEWIGPSTESEIERAARDGVGVVVVPIAFVSEHSETLVELDIEYREKAIEAGIPAYIRTPTVDALPVFIDGLVRLVRSVDGAAGCRSSSGGRICAPSWKSCPYKTGTL